jgi:hypothetical protein
MMKNIMHKMFLSCLKATELIEKKFQIKLSFKEKMQLEIHTMMCGACSNYQKHSEFMEKGLQKIQTKDIKQEEISELKKSILGKINES